MKAPSDLSLDKQVASLLGWTNLKSFRAWNENCSKKDWVTFGDPPNKNILTREPIVQYSSSIEAALKLFKDMLWVEIGREASMPNLIMWDVECYANADQTDRQFLSVPEAEEWTGAKALVQLWINYKKAQSKNVRPKK